MAIRAASHAVEVPAHTILTSYRVLRDGPVPRAELWFGDMVHIMEPAVTVQAAFDEDEDGVQETLHIPALAGRADLAGRLLAFGNSEHVGRVVAAVDEDIEGQPVAVLTITPSADLDPLLDLTDAEVHVVERMPVGTPQYRQATNGNAWLLMLDGAVPEHMAKMQEMLGAAHVEAVMLVLGLLAQQTPTKALSEVTLGDVAGAVMALAAEGTNIDGILARQGEALEAARQAGEVPWLGVAGGVAPAASGGS